MKPPTKTVQARQQFYFKWLLFFNITEDHFVEGGKLLTNLFSDSFFTDQEKEKKRSILVQVGR